MLFKDRKFIILSYKINLKIKKLIFLF